MAGSQTQRPAVGPVACLPNPSCYFVFASKRIEIAVNNPALERKTLSLVLHLETSKDKHGLSRNDFSKLFLERCGEQIAGWQGYSLKPNYATETFNVQLPFTQDKLVTVLETELDKLQQLGTGIDQTIQDVRKWRTPLSAGLDSGRDV